MTGERATPDADGELLEEPTARIGTVLRPFLAFAQLQAASGILLLVCTVVALLWANSPWRASYGQLFGTTVTAGFGELVISKSLLLWINDGLMAIFFFVVGLEIKREVLAGELSSLRQAALPVAAALGGMIAPALLYVALNAGRPSVSGWGVPMATDIAFALGVLALLGSRAPLSLKVFLTAFAIVDDIGAVLVIALFYTAEIARIALFTGFGFVALAALANWMGVRHPIVYTLIGVGMWVAFLKSGVHATVAGVLLAMAVPASARIDPQQFLVRARGDLQHFEDADDGATDVVRNADRQHALHSLEYAAERVQTPLQRMEHALHPWVSFFIMPVFALANAGVAFGGSSGLNEPVAWGILAGLVVGKPLGVFLMAFLAVRLGLAEKPADVTWRHIHGAGWLGGIGFTMALFISGLAFGDSPLVDVAKLAILAASLVAGVTGFLILRATPPAPAPLPDTPAPA